jgi:hypothetical protein
MAEERPDDVLVPGCDRGPQATYNRADALELAVWQLLR